MKCLLEKPISILPVMNGKYQLRFWPQMGMLWVYSFSITNVHKEITDNITSQTIAGSWHAETPDNVLLVILAVLTWWVLATGYKQGNKQHSPDKINKLYKNIDSILPQYCICKLCKSSVLLIIHLITQGHILLPFQNHGLWHIHYCKQNIPSSVL